MLDQLSPLHGVQEAQDLSIVQGRPGRDVPPKQHFSEVDAVGVSEAELPGEDEELTSLRRSLVRHLTEDSQAHWRSLARCDPKWAQYDPKGIRDDVRSTRWSWWIVDEGSARVEEDVKVYHMKQAALTVCRVCPAQWDCVKFAIDEGMHLTWASTRTDREVLASYTNWRDLVVEAEQLSISVQTMITELKQRKSP